MTDPPTAAPRTGDPTAPASESPASIGSNRRGKLQPHHRPCTRVFETSGPRVILERCAVEDPEAWKRLVGLLVGLLDMPSSPSEGGSR